MTVAERETEGLAREIRGLRKSPEEVRALLAGTAPFDPEEWRNEAPPATAEELEEMQAFLLEREQERERSLAAELAND